MFIASISDIKETTKVDKKDEIGICLRCGRKLKTPEARERGMGKICWEKSHVEKERRRLFDANHNT